MNYRIRIKNIERKLRMHNSSHLSAPPSDIENKNLIGGKQSLILSDVQDRIYSYYKTNKSLNTFLSYRNSYKNLFRIMGDRKIDSICNSDIEEFKIKRCKEVNFVSTNIDIRNIKAIFNKMVELGMLKNSKFKSVRQFKIEKKKILSIETVDIVRILSCCNDDQLRQIIRFTLLTASRISEVLNLKIKDIDFVRKIINIYQPKSNRYKVLPLTEKLSNLLEEIIGNDSNDRERYLFYDKLKNNLYLKLRADTVSKKFKKILRKLNLNEDFKFHSLRHSSITELIKNNVPLNVVKEIAGHTSINTTMIYSHVKSEDIQQAVNSLGY